MAHLDPTRRALLLACEAPRAFNWPEGVDWSLLVELARRGGVVGSVASSLERSPREPVARQALMRLVQLQLATEARNGFLLERTAEICSEGARRGLTLVPLKGTALLMGRPYHDLGSRPLSDIDLLAPREGYPQAASLLEELGYQAEGRERHALRHEHHVRFQREGTASVLVELHWTPFYTLYEDPRASRAVFERLVEHPFRGTRFSLLDLEDTLLALVTHLAHHRFRGYLKWLVDIAALLAHRPAVDWRVVTERAAGLGALRALHHTLWLVGDLLEHPLPEPAPESLPLRLLRRLCPRDGLVEGWPQPPIWQRTLIDFLLLDELAPALRYFLYKLPELAERRWGREGPDRLVRGGPFA